MGDEPRRQQSSASIDWLFRCFQRPVTPGARTSQGGGSKTPPEAVAPGVFSVNTVLEQRINGL